MKGVKGIIIGSLASTSTASGTGAQRTLEGARATRREAAMMDLESMIMRG